MGLPDLIARCYCAFLLLSLTTMASVSALAGEDLISDDGREVRINTDGTWHFRSDDRFANTRDGKRVRLKSDGTWQYEGNAPLQTEARFRSEITDVRLGRVEIETVRSKAHKSSRKQTQTVFYLEVAHSAAARSALRIAPGQQSAFSVIDSSGTEYPVVSLQPERLELAPGSSQTLVVRADGSPQWWNIKFMQLRIAPTLFDSAEAIELSQRLDDIEKREVEAFGQP